MLKDGVSSFPSLIFICFSFMNSQLLGTLFEKVEFGYIIDNFRLKQSLHCIVIASYANALMATLLCYFVEESLAL